MMAHRVRRLAVVVVVLVVIGAIAVVLTTRPKLEDHRSDVDRAWTPLRGPLGERYARLGEANAQPAAAGRRAGGGEGSGGGRGDPRAQAPRPSRAAPRGGCRRCFGRPPLPGGCCGRRGRWGGRGCPQPPPVGGPRRCRTTPSCRCC